MMWRAVSGLAILAATFASVQAIPRRHEGCDNGHMCTCYAGGSVGADCTKSMHCKVEVKPYVNEKGSRICTNVQEVYDKFMWAKNFSKDEPWIEDDHKREMYACDMLKLTVYCRNSKKLEPGNCITEETKAECNSHKSTLSNCDVDCDAATRTAPSLIALQLFALSLSLASAARLGSERGVR
mmetsp:Transcript_47790/g.84661  ORF Transcript_47790/g.84661 Transcript_47790/m.84661 type:complete len:182 (-) Transcript_47790:97-642(-)